jgi:hypothetical protein
VMQLREDPEEDTRYYTLRSDTVSGRNEHAGDNMIAATSHTQYKVHYEDTFIEGRNVALWSFVRERGMSFHPERDDDDTVVQAVKERFPHFKVLQYKDGSFHVAIRETADGNVRWKMGVKELDAFNTAHEYTQDATAREAQKASREIRGLDFSKSSLASPSSAGGSRVDGSPRDVGDGSGGRSGRACSDAGQSVTSGSAWTEDGQVPQQGPSYGHQHSESRKRPATKAGPEARSTQGYTPRHNEGTGAADQRVQGVVGVPISLGVGAEAS